MHCSKVKDRTIDLTDAIPDVAKNFIYTYEFLEVPSEEIEETIFKALNDLIDDFCDKG